MSRAASVLMDLLLLHLGSKIVEARPRQSSIFWPAARHNGKASRSSHPACGHGHPSAKACRTSGGVLGMGSTSLIRRVRGVSSVRLAEVQ